MKKEIQKNTLEEALMVLRNNITSALIKEAKEHGWSLSHFEVMKHVAEQGNPAMKDIAVRLHITPPSASALIDALVKKNLVLRSQMPEDRRTIRVTLSPTGQRLLSTIYKKKQSIFNSMLSKLNKEDKTELARIISKCISL